eukprot:719389-Rhodomonas_salina.1
MCIRDSNIEHTHTRNAENRPPHVRACHRGRASGMKGGGRGVENAPLAPETLSRLSYGPLSPPLQPYRHRLTLDPHPAPRPGPTPRPLNGEP